MDEMTSQSCGADLHRVLKNEYVVEHLFEFLKVEDIKSCRLIHHLWAKFGREVLRKNAKVIFNFTDPENDEARMKMDEISSRCKKCGPKNTLYKAFAFSGRVKPLVLRNFIEKLKDYIEELEIGCEMICKEEERIFPDFNPFILRHLSKLHISFPKYANVEFRLSFENISSSVQDIHLNNCVILLKEVKTRLAPKKLSLGPVNQYIDPRTGESVKFLVNSVFDLGNTQEIDLKVYWGSSSSLKLDFSDFGKESENKIERIVSLRYVDVQHWEMCNWKIKTLSLDGLPFPCRNKIEIKELCLVDMEVDLSLIYNPLAIRTLHLGVETELISDSAFFFPNLSKLSLEGEDCVSKLRYFSSNEHIKDLKLCFEENVWPPDDEISLNELPIGLKNLTLSALNIKGDIPYPIQKLFLREYSPLSTYQEIFGKFQAETIVVFYDLICAEDLDNFIALLNGNLSYAFLVIGQFAWENREHFSNSEFSNFVDKKGEFYFFEGRRGRAVTESEFDQYCEFE